MSFMVAAFQALLSFMATRPMAGKELHAEEMGHGPFFTRVDPRGDYCGWRCR